MLFHVFRHVKTHKFNTQRISKLLGNFSLTHTGWAREQVVTNRLFGFTQTSTRQFDRRRERFDRSILTKDHPLERLFEIFKHFCIVLGHILGWNARNFGDDILDLFGADGLATF